jgi:hypothetical protein
VIVKPLIVLKIADNDLYVPEHHLMDPTKGLTVFHNKNPTNQPKPFVLCPRINSLSSTAQLNNLDVTTALCDALDSIERAMTCSSKRGSQKHEFMTQQISLLVALEVKFAEQALELNQSTTH